MTAIQQQTETLRGELLGFNVRGSDGWGTGVLDSAYGRVQVVGKVLGVQAGSSVELEGVWDEHAQYGRRFKIRSCSVTTPVTAEGIVAWLSSTLPGLGQVRARELVRRFGEDLWTTIENNHRALCVVDGITLQRAEAMRDAYHKHRADRDHMISLRGWGLTDAQIARCLDEWRTLAKVIERIQQNPYQLAQVVYGFGFTRADTVAMKAGVKYDSPARIAAGVEHVLEDQMTKGHCFVPSGALRSITAKLLGVNEQLVAAAVQTAIRNGRAVRRGARVYSSRLDEAEAQCAAALRRLLGRAA